MTLKPLRGEMGHLFKRAGLFEQMGCAGNDLHLLFAPESRERLLVEVDHDVIFAANDEQSGGLNRWQGFTGEIGPPAARDNGFDLFAELRGCDERSRGAGACAKETQVKILRFVVTEYPPCCRRKAPSQQWNVKAQVTSEIFLLFFARSEQVEQKRRDACALQHLRDELITRATPAAAAAMREEHQPNRVPRHRSIPIEIGSLNHNPNRLLLLHLSPPKSTSYASNANATTKPARAVGH